MTVSSVNASSGSEAMQRPPAPPKDITRSGLEEMRDRIRQSGGEVPDGLDTLIENFDEAAGSSGKMTFEQFKAFAAENGVTLPDPPKGAGGGPPRSEQAASGQKVDSGSGSTSVSTSSADDDVSSLSDAALMIRAARGDAEAIQELQKRQEAKVNQSVGRNLDTVA